MERSLWVTILMPAAIMAAANIILVSTASGLYTEASLQGDVTVSLRNASGQNPAVAEVSATGTLTAAVEPPQGEAHAMVEEYVFSPEGLIYELQVSSSGGTFSEPSVFGPLTFQIPPNQTLDLLFRSAYLAWDDVGGPSTSSAKARNGNSGLIRNLSPAPDAQIVVTIQGMGNYSLQVTGENPPEETGTASLRIVSSLFDLTREISSEGSESGPVPVSFGIVLLPGESLSQSMDTTTEATGEFLNTNAVAPLESTPAGDIRLEIRSTNPFRDRITVRYDLPQPGYAELAIHDAIGRFIRRLDSGFRESGTHEASWDATSEHGIVPGGIYFARLSTARETEVRKLVLFR